MIGPALQSTAVPDQAFASLTFLAVLASVVLSVVILAKGVRGYRRTGDAALAGLAAGILLLSGVPLVANVALVTTGALAATTVTVVGDLIQLLGLGVILLVIYRTGR